MCSFLQHCFSYRKTFPFRLWVQMSTTSSFFFVVFVLLSRTLKISLACTDILLTSDYLGKRHFTALSANESLTAGLVSGHAAYSTRNAEHDHDMPLPVLYLYHIVLQQDGRGRWVINSALGKEDSAIMFMDSWAVMPHTCLVQHA